MKQRLVAALSVMLIVAASQAAAMAAGTSNGSGPLTVVASTSSATFAVGEPIAVNVELKVTRGKPRTVSSYAHSALSVTSLERDGVPIAAEDTLILFEEDPLLLQVESLVKLRRGDAVAIPVVLEGEGSTGVQLVDAALDQNEDRQGHTADVYTLEGPGVYSVVFEYLYAGDDGGARRVYRKPVTSNELTFEVTSGGAPAIDPTKPHHSTRSLEIDTKDQDFRNQVQQALDDIAQTTAVGEICVNRLKNSANVHKIKRGHGRHGSEATAQNNVKATNGTGTGSTIKWEPSNTDRYDTDVNRDPTSSLMHELIHACDIDDGIVDPSLDPKTKIKRAEIKATRTENAHRHAKGLPLRTKYGGKKLPEPIR